MRIEDKMLLGVIIGIIEMIVIVIGWKKYDIISIDNIDNKHKLFVSIIAVLTVFFNILLFKQNYRINALINICAVYTILTVLAGIDLKKKIIPNAVLGIGFIIKALLLIYEWIIYPLTIKATFFNVAAGFAFGLLFLLVLSFITKHGIGYGDVKMFAWIGFCMGVFDTYSILFYSVLVAAIAGIYLILFKKVEKKKELPFAPFVYVGSYLVFCMTFIQS